MHPGPDPSELGLPELTQMEEIMISPVHVLLQVWQVRGGQSKYKGHICNFFRDVGRLHSRIPHLPQECDIVILQRRNAEGDQATADGGTRQTYEDFRVRREPIRQWLQYLYTNNPIFRRNEVTIDWHRVDELPEDLLAQDQVHNFTEEELPESFEETGPPESEDQVDEEASVFSRGFVPNLAADSTELRELNRAAAAGGNGTILLTVPNIQGTPINEASNYPIAISAFPTLFPTGAADFTANRTNKVSMSEWAAHLIRFKGMTLKH